MVGNCAMTKAAETAPVAYSGTVPTLAGVDPSAGGSDKVALDFPLSTGAYRTEDHKYYFNGIGPYPSVTTILGIIEKQAVSNYRLREVAIAAIRNPRMIAELLEDSEDEAVAWLVAKADEKRDAAATLGSSIHTLADMEGMVPGAHERPVEGFEASEQEIPYLEAFRGFLDRYGREAIVSSEKMVWSLNGYAGTYDLLMMIACQKHIGLLSPVLECDEPELWLIDIKTGADFYPDHGLQLAAYRWADNIMLPGDPRVYPMPHIHRTGILHLRPDRYPDTGWRLIEYPTSYDLDYLPFLGLLEYFNWTKEGRFTKTSLGARKVDLGISKRQLNKL